MGFFEKVKNMFTEEVEDDEVKVEKIKNEVTHVSIESPNAKDNSSLNDDIDNDVFVSTKEESKPIFFDDNDFKDLNFASKYVEEKNETKEKELYGGKSKEDKTPEEKKIFKPTPIISPIYGVLDKNYHKEDIVSRNDFDKEEAVIPKESPIDTIRKKAYGTLEDELENTLFGSNSILFRKEEPIEESVEINEVSNDILSDLTDDISKELDELLEKKEKHFDNDVEQAEEQNKTIENRDIDDEDLLGFIDSTLYKGGDE